MGQLSGIVTIGGSPAAGVTVRFYKNGVSMGDSITNEDGSYAKYLTNGSYTAEKISPPPTVPLLPSPINVTSPPKILNLGDVKKPKPPKPKPKKATPKKAAPKKVAPKKKAPAKKK